MNTIKEKPKSNKSNKFDFLGSEFDKERDREEKGTDLDNQPTNKKTQQSASSSNSLIAETATSPVERGVTAEKQNLGKRSNPIYKTVGIFLPQKDHKEAKKLLMDDPKQRDFSDLMTELLEQWLKNKKE